MDFFGKSIRAEQAENDIILSACLYDRVIRLMQIL